uniref:MFS transporter n=1 Tax=uncultured Caulobacter sp. TaxID=158749 RepID=UPI0025FB6C58|nr:MFS transporter [uncultured Caulobacter sp.]
MSDIDIPNPKAGPTATDWRAILSLSFGVFGLVTAELLPVSVLTPMAADLKASHGAVGQAVTATAVVAAFAGPLVVLGSGRIDRRLLVWVFMVLLALSSLMAALATSLPILLLARGLLGFALGGYWAMMTALALRLAPHDASRAVSIIVMGVSAATVFAAPVAAMLAAWGGWRSTFLVLAGLGLVALAVQVVALPRLPSSGPTGLRSLLAALQRPAVLLGLGVSITVVSGHFAGFTFIRPFLEQIPKLSISAISMTLLVFGGGGFLGNIAAGALAARHPAWALGGCALLIGLAALMLVFAGRLPTVAILATAIWGLAFGGVPVSAAIWNARAAPDLTESAGALMSSAFQIAIAGGAVIGGALVDQAGPSGGLAYAATAVLAGSLVMLGLSRSKLRTQGDL